MRCSTNGRTTDERHTRLACDVLPLRVSRDPHAGGADMKLPWQRRSRKDRVVVARSDDRFVYVQAEGARVLRCGMELNGDGNAAAFANWYASSAGTR